jgi:hypothetical protein
MEAPDFAVAEGKDAGPVLLVGTAGGLHESALVTEHYDVVSLGDVFLGLEVLNLHRFGELAKNSCT